MKSSILRASGLALACALGLSACGGGDGDLPLTVQVGGGITKTGLVLRNERNGDELPIEPAAAGLTVNFPKYVSTDDEFEIVVKSRPENTSACTVTNPKARANYYTIAQIGVSCTITTHQLYATVTGLTGSGLILINGASRTSVTPAQSGTKLDLGAIPEGGLYGVTIYQQPAGQTCSVANGTGVVDKTDVTNVTVTCSPAAGA